jgi:hypothetical protein
MKKLTALYLLGSFYVSLMSQTDTSQLKTYWDALFRRINEQKIIPGGYLWDKGLPDSSVWWFNGKMNDSSAGFGQWGNTYQYWVNSAVSPAVAHEPYHSVRNRMQTLFKNEVIVVPLLDVSSSRFRAGVFDAGHVFLDSISGMITVDKQHAFLEPCRTYIAAPFVQVVYKPEVKLLFSHGFYFTNSVDRIRRVRIRINNGPWTDVAINEVVNIRLSHTGIHSLTIEYTRSSTVFYCNSSLTYQEKDKGNEGPVLTGNPMHLGDELGNIYATPIRETETKEPLGAFISYIPGRTDQQLNTCIRKPVIFVEGIDFGYKDHPTGCYGGKCGNMGLIDLMDGRVFNPYEAKFQNWYEDWEPIKKAPALIAELQKRGYDLYYLDFHNGADYMENNAMLLVELIKRINAVKCTSEEIVVIGASMGGQIARYALSYMEKKNMPHCTRTYLSFDSPHQGANIPLGLQYQLAYYKGLLPGITDKMDRKINRAATRQLLVYHCGSGSQAGPDGQRKDFMDALYGLGNYPSYCRNIALINGNVSAGDQGYNMGDKLLSINPYGGKALYEFMQISSTAFSCYNFSGDYPIVMESKFPLKKKDAQMVPWSTVCYDHIPGAKRFDLKESKAIYGVFNVINHHDASCFIPSVSGLDVSTNDPYYNISINIRRSAVEKGKYPFHAYYGPKNSSEEHMMLTDDNIQWIVSEIEKNGIELPAVLTSVYNYGQYERFLFRGTKISAGGILQFNGNYLTGTGKGQFDKPAEQGSVFEVFTTDCSPVMTIGDGGQLLVGDVSGVNKAVVHFRKGSTLLIQKGGLLKIFDNSSLIIEEGALLIYEAGARISLNGHEALLQLDGVLRLEKDAVFSVEKDKNMSTGFVKFRNAGGGFGKASLECIGNNTEINLSGTGKNTDVLLQIEGDMILPEKVNGALRSLKIMDCMVRYGRHSRIITGANCLLQQVRFENLPWAVPNESDGIVCSKPESLFVNGCSFEKLNHGIKCKGSGTSNWTLQYSEFIACNTGVLSDGNGVDMVGNIFRDCRVKGVSIISPANDQRIHECQFTGNTKGVEIDNANKPSRFVFISGGFFRQNTTGLDIRQCITTLSCARFLNNQQAAVINNGELNMSRNKVSAGLIYTSVGGDNTFAYNNTGITLSGVMLYLNGGYNNFIAASGVGPCRFFTGNIGYSTQTQQAVAPYALLAANNYWEPAISGLLGSGSISHYLLMFPYPGGGYTMNYFTGNMEKTINTRCYKTPCNACEQVIEYDQSGAKNMKGTISAVMIAPSPVGSELHVAKNYQDSIVYGIRLYALDGRVMYQGSLAGLNLVIPVETFAEGIYLLEIHNGYATETKKIIIRR